MPLYPTTMEFHIAGGIFSGDQATDEDRKESYTPFDETALRKRLEEETDPVLKSYWAYCLQQLTGRDGRAEANITGEELIMKWLASAVAKEYGTGKRIEGSGDSALAWIQRVRFVPAGPPDEGPGKSGTAVQEASTDRVYEVQYTESGQEGFAIYRIAEESRVPWLLKVGTKVPILGPWIEGMVPQRMKGQMPRVLQVMRERAGVVTATYQSTKDMTQQTGIALDDILADDPLAQYVVRNLLGKVAAPRLVRSKQY